MSNTYHLYLRPGIEVVERCGGLHRFMGWDRALMTDSGGYQIFSLSRLCKIDDAGVTFRSHIDGSEHFLSPELAVRYQEALGADIIMVLDECPPSMSSREHTEAAMERTHRWAVRCREAHQRENQSLFAIVQGGIFPELRQRSAEYLTGLDFAGYAIGGLSVGEPKAVTNDIVSKTTALLPEDKPRYLMGVGSPEDIVTAVGQGIDLFDCALPTRVARKGALFTAQGRCNIRNAAYREMDGPFDDSCDCETCRNFSATYLHHLFRSQELLAYRLATIHNLHFMENLMRQLRAAISDGTYETFREQFLNNYQVTSDEVRLTQRQKWLERWHNEKAGS